MNIKHNKQEVLQQGLKLFCQKGYNALGVDEICKTTKMTKGAFYHSYQSKEQFLLEAVQLYAQNNIARIKLQLADGQLSPLARLMEFYTQMLQAQPKVNYIGCFINSTMAELGHVNATIGEATSIAYHSFVDAILPTVQEAQKAKELNPNLDARHITELLHTTFYGALTIAKSARNAANGLQLMNILFNNLKYIKKTK